MFISHKLSIIYLIIVGKVSAISEFSVPGIILESNNSVACNEVLLENLDNFVICFYFQLGNVTSELKVNYTILHLYNSSDYFELVYNQIGYFAISYKVQTHMYPKLIEFNDWLKLCVGVTDGTDVTFEVNNRATRKSAQDEKFSELDELAEIYSNILMITDNAINNPSETKDTSVVVLCAGKYDQNYNSIVGSLAGVNVQEKSPKISDIAENICSFESGQSPSVFHGGFKTVRGIVKKVVHSSYDLCHRPYLFLLLANASQFSEHYLRCHNLDGRLLLPDEANIFSDILKIIYLNIVTYKLGEDKQINTYTWLSNGNENSVQCQAYNMLERKLKHVPCRAELKFNFCMVPKYLDLYFYGAFNKYDSYYNLLSRNYSIFLRGDEGTSLERVNDRWILTSEFSEENLTLYNSSVPIGRFKWMSSDSTTEHLLTFTHCRFNQFTCSNGECLPIKCRCNGTVECLDATDEEECLQLEKERGYSTKQIPPPRRNESSVIIQYFVKVWGMADISTDDGIALLDTYVTMTWHDPRIIFHNPYPNEEIDCQEIWSPVLTIGDGYEEMPFQLKYETFRSNCFIFLSVQDSAQPNTSRSKSDSFMGQQIDGNDVAITYQFSGLINAPCNFDLKTYPFGKRNCSLTLMIDDLYLDANYMLESHIPAYDKVNVNDSITLLYLGRKNLGEFQFIGATHKLLSAMNNKILFLTFTLETLYGYHLVNSFTPSLLLCIISYSTLFFPLNDFNERIMVSLTALLVLTALFSQASNASVRTPYFKYLDLWYVVLMIFCFFIVIANVMLHNMDSHLNKQFVEVRLIREEEPFIKGECHSFVKIERVNILLQLIFITFLFLFLILFFYAALLVI